MPQSTYVELALLDLSVHFHDTDSNDEARVQSLTSDILDQATCLAAEELIIRKTDNESDGIRELLRRDIQRFLRPPDQLLALGSVLLKSRAFWKRNGDADYEKPSRCLVRLPRTKHKKPYIPNKATSNNSDDGSLSVSHQYPFVGATQRLPMTTTTNEASPASFPQPLVGCDIVVREALNTRLYDTWDDFLQVFAASFAPEEWKLIQQATPCDNHATAQNARVDEFFLRWAVKEAYTKALGVGLGFDFATFHVQFDSPVADGLGNYLRTKRKQPTQQPVSLRGKVHVDAAAAAAALEGDYSSMLANATWEFFFVHLSEDPWSWVCVAVGPVGNNDDEETSRIHLQVYWTSIEELSGYQKF